MSRSTALHCTLELETPRSGRIWPNAARERRPTEPRAHARLVLQSATMLSVAGPAGRGNVREGGRRRRGDLGEAEALGFASRAGKEGELALGVRE